MNDDSRSLGDEDVDDRRMTTLVRESQYLGRPSDEFRRNLLRELEHNFSNHRIRVRVLFAACAVVATGALFFQAEKLGGDVFDMIPKRVTEDGVTILEAPFSGNRMGIAESGLLSPEQINEMLAAGMGEIVRIDAWTFDGVTDFSTVYELSLDGHTTQVAHGESEGSKTRGRRHLAFFAAGVGDDLDAIYSGELPPQGTRLVTYDGRSLLMKVWVWEYPELGRIEYWSWEP